MEEREEQENKNQNRAPEGPRKAEPSQETAHTLLIAPMNLMPHFQPDPMMSPMMTMYLQTLHELCKMRQKVRERKRQLWQLLLQRNGEQATPTVLVVAGLSSSAHFATTTQRTFPRAPPSSSKSGCCEQQRRKKLGKSLRHSTW